MYYKQLYKKYFNFKNKKILNHYFFFLNPKIGITFACYITLLFNRQPFYQPDVVEEATPEPPAAPVKKKKVVKRVKKKAAAARVNNICKIKIQKIDTIEK